MEYNVFLDESGDGGWNFSGPYMNGGSSRFLVITFVIVPKDKISVPKRLVKRIYNKYKFDIGFEVKGSELKPDQKINFADRVEGLLRNDPDIYLGAVVVNKVNVPKRFHGHAEKLYTYMVSKALLANIHTHEHVELIRDERIVKTKSSNSLCDYLKITLLAEYESDTILVDCPKPSHHDDNLIFVDWASNIIWRSYEFGALIPFNRIQGRVHITELYFASQPA